MNLAQAKEAICEQFVTAFGALQPGVPIALPDEAFSPPSPAAPWARLTIIHSIAANTTHGPKAQIRNDGRAIVGVFAPFNSGSSAVDALAVSAKLALAMRNALAVTGEPVVMLAGAVNEQPTTNGFAMINVTIPFYWYETSLAIVPLPPPKILAIYMRGQSNLEAQHISGDSTPTSVNIVPSYYTVPLPAITVAQQISNNPGNPQTFELTYANAALQPRDGSSAGYPYDQLANFGPEIAMGYQINKVGQFAIIKSAIGNSSLAVDWDPTITNSAWQVSLAFAQANVVALGAPIGVRTWNQAESDAGNSVDAGLYESRLAALDAADLAIFPGTPLVITLINARSILPYWATVNAGILAFAASRPYVYVVTPQPFWLYDGTHLGASGLIHLGKAMATQVCVALGLTPPADPEPQTVVTDKLVYNGSEPIVVTWTGLTDPQNWINIVAPDAPLDSQFGSWVFANGTQVQGPNPQSNPNGSHSFPFGAAGTWCARLLTDANQDGNFLIAQSVTFTVT